MMNEGTYIWRRTRPPGKGWTLLAVNNGWHWINRLWYRAEDVDEEKKGEP